MVVTNAITVNIVTLVKDAIVVSLVIVDAKVEILQFVILVTVVVKQEIYRHIVMLVLVDAKVVTVATVILQAVVVYNAKVHIAITLQVTAYNVKSDTAFKE